MLVMGGDLEGDPGPEVEGGAGESSLAEVGLYSWNLYVSLKIVVEAVLSVFALEAVLSVFALEL